MPSWLAATLAVASAAVVLVVELVSIRLAAPYVGLTLETYSAGIGVALLGISLGAAFGGSAADRHDPREYLGPLLVVGGVLVLLVHPIAHAAGPLLQGEGSLGAVLLVGLSTLAPVTLLSAVAPALVKVALDELRRAGSVAGAISALGTAGALFGTFVTGFVLLAHLSTRQILLASAVLLIALGILTTLVLRRARPPAALLAGVLAAGGLLALEDGPCDEETRYFCARVETAGALRSLYLDDLQHARVDLRRPADLQLDYTQTMAAAIEATFPPRRPLDVLHIGAGGLALQRHVHATRRGSRSTVLELDPDIIALDRRSLGFRPGPDVDVRVGDARLGIRELGAGAFDVVLGDAFASRSVPWHLTTEEFVGDVARVLSGDGIYVLNLIDGRQARFLAAELATLRRRFRHTAVLAVRPAASGLRNYIVVASRRPVDARAWSRARPRDRLVERLAPGPVLRDDRAPVDQLLARE